MKPQNHSHIIDEKAPFALLELSVFLDTPYTRRSEALQSVYADMLLAGCGPYDRAGFLDALGHIGASCSIQASHNVVSIHLSARTAVLKKALTILSHVIEKPRFAPTELTRIKKQYLEELRLEKEDPNTQAYQHFISTLIPKEDARYAYNTETTAHEATTVRLQEIRALHTQVRRARARYACGGTQKACAEIDQILARLKFHFNTQPPSTRKTVPPLQKRTLILTDIPQKSNIEFEIGAGVPLLRTDPDYAPLHFGMSVLGLRGGFAGRLMSIVREKEGLTYGIYGHLEGISRYSEGIWRISTFFAPKDAFTGITATLREIARIQEKGITEDELTRFKQILKTRFTLIEDSLIRRVSERLSLESLGLTQEEYELYKKEIDAMTLTRVNTAVKKYLNPKTVVISGAGPVEGVAKTLKTLL